MLFKDSQCSQSLACLPLPRQIIFILCMRFVCMQVCVMHACMLEALQGRKTACESWELELTDFRCWECSPFPRRAVHSSNHQGSYSFSFPGWPGTDYVQPGWLRTLISTCLCFLNAGIKVVYHHALAGTTCKHSFFSFPLPSQCHQMELYQGKWHTVWECVPAPLPPPRWYSTVNTCSSVLQFLIDKNGCVVKRYGPMEEPQVIITFAKAARARAVCSC